MSKDTELTVGGGILLVATSIMLAVLIQSYLDRHETPGELTRAAPVVVGLVTYLVYAASAFLANAPLPEFARDHLFDGLAPAAVVAIVVKWFPADNADKIFLPRIKRPIFVLLIFFLTGALAFGLTGFAAVFSSGSNNFFGMSTSLSGGMGAYVFGAGYLVTVLVTPGKHGLIWWFIKRKDLTSPPGHSLENAAKNRDISTPPSETDQRQSPDP